MEIGFMKVIYIRDSKSRGYIRVGLSDGEDKKEYTLSNSDWKELGSPLVGDEIEDISPLLSADARYRAKLYALRILGFADNNERMLIRKLTAKGISFDIAKETAAEMRSLGYIDERRQLKRLIEKEVNIKLSGRRKLMEKLVAKGYSRSEIEEELMDLISHGVVDFEKSRAKLIEKKLPRDAGEEEILRLCYNYGY